MEVSNAMGYGSYSWVPGWLEEESFSNAKNGPFEIFSSFPLGATEYYKSQNRKGIIADAFSYPEPLAKEALKCYNTRKRNSTCYISWWDKLTTVELSDEKIKIALHEVDNKLSETISWLGEREETGLTFWNNFDCDVIINCSDRILSEKYDFNKWYEEVVDKFASEELAIKLSGRVKSINRKFSILRRLVNALIRRFCSGSFTIDFRLGFRKKTNIIFKNLDDEHYLNSVW